LKRTLVMDIECYVDYFLVMFKAIDTLKTLAFELFDGHPLDRATIVGILKTYRVVTFNGLDYDLPLLALALTGVENAALKEASNLIIEKGLRGWQFEHHYNIKVPTSIDHIDLREPVPGVQISLKLYGARLHSKRLQDLPIEHTASITPEQRPLLRTYCENDLDTTLDLWHKATPAIKLREVMTDLYGIDLRSKSDAQIAEAVIKSEVAKIKGEPSYRPDLAPGTSYKYRTPTFIKFASPHLQEILRKIQASDFVVTATGGVDLPPALTGAKIVIGKSTYRMGIGGLHSCEKRSAHIASPEVKLIDRDVTSYYPSIILQCELAPKHIGPAFLKVYRGIFETRLAAKARAGDLYKRIKALKARIQETDNDLAELERQHVEADTEASAKKLSLNGSFGKFGSKWSALYSPDLMIQVTVTGQLALLMLIERLEAAGVPVVSANTDGIVMACPAVRDAVMNEIVAQWERDTGLETEETRYRALFSRDVNNYCALKEGGGVKTKGVLVAPGVQKNPDNEIVSEAVTSWLDKGVPIGQTILTCRDVRKFLRVKRVTGGAKYGDEYLGRVVRWYRRAGEARHIEYVTNGNKVGGSDGAAPLMELPDALPNDIDYGWYLQEANDLLHELGACHG